MRPQSASALWPWPWPCGRVVDNLTMVVANEAVAKGASMADRGCVNGGLGRGRGRFRGGRARGQYLARLPAMDVAKAAR